MFIINYIVYKILLILNYKRTLLMIKSADKPKRNPSEKRIVSASVACLMAVITVLFAAGFIYSKSQATIFVISDGTAIGYLKKIPISVPMNLQMKSTAYIKTFRKTLK